jgi:hypothetical protein
MLRAVPAATSRATRSSQQAMLVQISSAQIIISSNSSSNRGGNYSKMAGALCTHLVP